MAGIVQSVSQGSWNFLYRTSTTKDPKWNPGDRVVLPDGREFVYAKSASALNTGLGCSFSGTGYTAYTAAAVSAAVGDTEITVPAATHAALTKDELVGGYVLLMLSGLTECRQIVGNDAASANALFKIRLDAELSVAVTTSTGVETYKNPYSALTASGNVALAKAGIPATTVSAASTYFWVQKKGFAFVSPQSGITGGQNGACWRHDGSLDTLDNGIEDDTTYVSSQIAGYAAIGSADGNGPLFMLQG
jgi:hypothetical protein